MKRFGTLLLLDCGAYGRADLAFGVVALVIMRQNISRRDAVCDLTMFVFALGNVLPKPLHLRTQACHRAFSVCLTLRGVAEELIMEVMKERDAKNKDRRGNKLKNVKKTKNENEGTTSEVLTRLIKRLQPPLKEDFIVVQMHHRCEKCKEYIVNGKLWIDKQTERNHAKEPSYALCVACYDKEKKKLTKRQVSEVERVLEEEKEESAKKKEEDVGALIVPPKGVSPTPMVPKSKKGSVLKVKLDLPMSERMLRLRQSEVKCAKSTKDPDPDIDSEYFKTRQEFLSLCQGNHYQFDQLRRAKHSTMMILYHLHNPELPGFVHSCNLCSTDILKGRRWHCNTCKDFDICDNCRRTKPHPHSLTPHQVGKSSYVDEQTRKARARAIRLHMSLLIHASSCKKATCPSKNCVKMKALLKHGQTCKKRASGGCHICRRIMTLLHIHARQCRSTKCPVPQCSVLRAHLRKVQLAADHRRRQAYRSINRAPSTGNDSKEKSRSGSRGRGSGARTNKRKSKTDKKGKGKGGGKAKKAKKTTKKKKTKAKKK